MSDDTELTGLVEELVDKGARSAEEIHRSIEQGDFSSLGFLFDWLRSRDGVRALALFDETGLSGADREAIADIYEAVFDHRSFTGRSGTAQVSVATPAASTA